VAESSVALPPEGKGRDMPEYRIYTLTDANKIAGPSQSSARTIRKPFSGLSNGLDGHDLEVWQGARVVIRLKSKQ
jgi:hypothetical protein